MNKYIIIFLIVTIIIFLISYLVIKFSKNVTFKEVLIDIKHDIQKVNLTINKTKNIFFNAPLKKKISEIILMVEEKNNLAKLAGQRYLSGEEKKLEVLNKLADWISGLTGTTKKSLDFMSKYESYISKIIDECIDFANGMNDKVNDTKL